MSSAREPTSMPPNAEPDQGAINNSTPEREFDVRNPSHIAHDHVSPRIIHEGYSPRVIRGHEMPSVTQNPNPPHTIQDHGPVHERSPSLIAGDRNFGRDTHRRRGIQMDPGYALLHSIRGHNPPQTVQEPEPGWTVDRHSSSPIARHSSRKTPSTQVAKQKQAIPSYSEPEPFSRTPQPPPLPPRKDFRPSPLIDSPRMAEGSDARTLSNPLIRPVAGAFFLLHLLGLLFLPYLYLVRVDQVLKDANLTIEEIRCAVGYTSAREEAKEVKSIKDATDAHDGFDPSKLDQPYRQLKKEWNKMIDDFVEEWKSLNMVAAVLVPGILSLLSQIDGAGRDPVARSLAFWSLISALWCLVYGCFYIIQFRRMRSDYVMIEWALEAERRDMGFWNTWVMLALPAIALAWSVLVFIITIIWFMWRSRATPSPALSFTATSSTELGFHIFICTILGIAAVYFVLAFIRFFHYGAPVTSCWRRHMKDIMIDITRLVA